MEIEALAGAVAIIATIMTTTAVVLGRITRLEVRIAELSVTVTNFESRIRRLEREAERRQEH